MSKIVDIDLNTNPTVKDVVAELEPGAKLVIRATLQKKDDQTASVRLNVVEEDDRPDDEDDDLEELDEADDDSTGAGQGY